MRFKRGDVVLVLFPNSDLRTAKRRPVLVVQADELKTGLKQIVVAMITSNLSRSGHPSRVLVDLQTIAGRQSGLLTDSVVMTDNLATVLDSEVDKAIGSLSEMESVDKALCCTLGISEL